ncbi:hypothetical protein ELQ35_13645 [Peribacillus cavernae]|uniref:S1 motif domain-containing protein n=1 Tax=Peribacillus cavernae TaxID=1674310 RepID=A0A433HIR9_9BACI|nr:S1-like domain-containing RNA-binding protein [Peribacillus cavernae]MDQ0217820.1 putative RNA-binding protein (virulence factor B family) [Peribacillus cavernae]RUQ28268.1 hypothetical protein ELQ35_13645 [Peribacillus cavernae]
MTKIQAGTVVELEVEREADFGFFLTDGSEDVLLHNNELEEEIEIGNTVHVFLYHDKQGRISATMTIPDIQAGIYGWAEVVNVKSDLGVFANIGISKDILVSVDDLPSLKHLWPAVGDKLYISLKTDRYGRLFGKLATEDIIQEIAVQAPEKARRNKSVEGHVYRLLKVGSFMMSTEGYRCFIHETQRKEEPRLGEYVEGRVIDIKEDGSLNVSLLPFKQEKMADDSQVIYNYLVNRGGVMPYSDKSTPEDIQFHFGLSKGAFKRALGKLMKEEKVYQEEGWTYSSDRK